MNIYQKNNNIILTDIHDFDLYHIFECGQCFRWDKQDDDSYIGVVANYALKISQKDDCVTLYDTSLEDFENFWFGYFDLDRDYSEIKNTLKKDVVLNTAINSGQGIRLLKQDIWECVVSFIISASNNIPRIKKIISSLCQNFGDEFEYMGNTYYTFPTPQKIASLNLEDLAIIKAGFRDKYILDAARKFTSNEINNELLENSDNAAAKEMLMTINGIGNKVSDCILLFGMSRFDTFPVDVWIKRIMEYCYFDNKQKIPDIISFSQDKFGVLCGFAQQYLFFYARENQIDAKSII